MRFYEFEAKQILRKFGVPIPEGKIAYNAEEAVQIFQSLDQEVVIKAQVLSGGRMKAGGVKFANNANEVKKVTEEIMKITIKIKAL